MSVWDDSRKLSDEVEIAKKFEQSVFGFVLHFNFNLIVDSRLRIKRNWDFFEIRHKLLLIGRSRPQNGWKLSGI